MERNNRSNIISGTAQDGTTCIFHGDHFLKIPADTPNAAGLKYMYTGIIEPILDGKIIKFDYNSPNTKFFEFTFETEEIAQEALRRIQAPKSAEAHLKEKDIENLEGDEVLKKLLVVQQEQSKNINFIALVLKIYLIITVITLVLWILLAMYSSSLQNHHSAVGGGNYTVEEAEDDESGER